MNERFVAVTDGGAVLCSIGECDWGRFGSAMESLSAPEQARSRPESVLIKRSSFFPVIYLSDTVSSARLDALIVQYEYAHMEYLLLLPDQVDFLRLRCFTPSSTV